MQASEYIQFAITAAGLALIAWVRISFMRRLRADASVAAYTVRERTVRSLAFACIGIAVALIFLPF